MTRKLPLLLLGLIALFPVTAHAQILDDKLEVFGGYSYMVFHNAPSTNLNGWEFSGQYNYNKWLGAVGDIGADYGKWGGIGITVHTYLFGPQISYPLWRISPFAHVLFGAAHRSGSGLTSTSFAYAIGAGVDYKLAPSLYWRVIQGEYLPTHFFGFKQSNTRFSTGIVFRF